MIRPLDSEENQEAPGEGCGASPGSGGSSMRLSLTFLRVSSSISPTCFLRIRPARSIHRRAREERNSEPGGLREVREWP